MEGDHLLQQQYSSESVVQETAAVAVAEARDEGLRGNGACSGGLGSTNSAEDDTDKDADKNYAGNRWPRQETLALLKIRSDMGSVFRDSSLKAPLWEQVSRKLAELGYNRTAKKCKEKFENVYKYHKRTKDQGRINGKPEKGKAYRFSDHLQVLDQNKPNSLQQMVVKPPISTVPLSTINPSTNITISHNSVPNSLPLPVQPQSNPIINLSRTAASTVPSSFPNNNNMIPPNLFSSSTSSSTASDEELGISRPARTRKRKWKDFFVRLTKEVMAKQENLQSQFLETLEKIEHQRVAREEAWRTQEMARLNREHDILAQERSNAAAKDKALISFLQKISDQQNLGQSSVALPEQLLPLVPQAQPPSQPRPVLQAPNNNLEIRKISSDHENGYNYNAINSAASSSRWPKAEVEALIKLRTEMDLKYQENAPKGPLWEEISTGMKKLGYDRSSKRCKEKWENINKYFKKVKESNKKRPEDSKTCPYFHQLDAVYKEKTKTDHNYNKMEPLMVQPEQQWPLPVQNQQAIQELRNIKRPENGDQRDHKEMQDEDEHHDDDDEEEKDLDESEEEDEGHSFEIVTTKQSSLSVAA